MFFLAVRISEYPSFWESVQFQTVGFIIVMLTLTLLWVTIAGVGRIFCWLEARGCFAGESAGLASASQDSGDLDPETVAVIAAAVSAIVRRPHRITSIQVCADSHQRLNAWSQEGRRHIHHTRKTR